MLEADHKRKTAELRSALVSWYRENKRDLPWRKNRRPYSVWVSEVMLQQTQVETVKPYFERFMKRFPTPADLARASEDEVLAEWSGLGYYRRARQLHAGVKEVVERYGGEVPEDPDERRSLPSVGPYTAGAIGSLAFGKEEAIVDGNVARVLSRLHFVEAPLYSAASQKALWKHAAALVEGAIASGAKPLEVNEGLMELGALVCRPKSPACEKCPWNTACEAHQRGQADALPKRKPKKKKKVLERHAWLVIKASASGDTVYLQKAKEGLFVGLWNVPLFEDKPPDAFLRVGKVEHILTHRRLVISVWRSQHSTDLFPGDEGRWVPVDQITGDKKRSRELGISSLTKKILKLLETPELPLG